MTPEFSVMKLKTLYTKCQLAGVIILSEMVKIYKINNTVCDGNKTMLYQM